MLLVAILTILMVIKRESTIRIRTANLFQRWAGMLIIICCCIITIATVMTINTIVTIITIVTIVTITRVRTPNLHCFKAGDARVNEQPGLATLHTLWLRCLFSSIVGVIIVIIVIIVIQSNAMLQGAQPGGITAGSAQPPMVGRQGFSRKQKICRRCEFSNLPPRLFFLKLC